MSDNEKFGRSSQRMPELSEADKARIRAEEEYRAQVRKDQDTPPMKSFRLEKSSPQQTQGLAGLMTFLLIGGGVWWWLSQPHGVSTTNSSVTYAVNADCPVDVTYTVNGMDTQQEQNVPGNWTKTVQGSSLINTLIAQLQCDGVVTVGISGEKGANKTAASQGEFAIAQVSYP